MRGKGTAGKRMDKGKKIGDKRSEGEWGVWEGNVKVSRG